MSEIRIWLKTDFDNDSLSCDDESLTCDDLATASVRDTLSNGRSAEAHDYASITGTCIAIASDYIALTSDHDSLTYGRHSLVSDYDAVTDGEHSMKICN